MKRAIPCTCLAAVFAVGLSAQTPSTSPGASASAQSDKDSAKTVTVTGCLKAGDAPGSFVLANIKGDKDKATTSASASTTTTGTAGTAGTAGAAGTAGTTTTTTTTTVNKDLENATVSLTGSPAGVTLGDHVGHMVQITGTLAGQSASASATTAAAPTTPGEPPAAAATAAKAQPSIAVTAFSMVSGSCSM